MSYSNALSIAYNLGEIDFGAGGDVTAIKVPAHVTAAAIRDISVAVTETFTNVTTGALIQLGTAADADKFAEMDMGAAADTNGYGILDDADAIKAAGQSIDLQADGDAGAALTQLELVLAAPTGGTPAGKGFVTITIDWWG